MFKKLAFAAIVLAIMAAIWFAMVSLGVML